MDLGSVLQLKGDTSSAKTCRISQNEGCFFRRSSAHLGFRVQDKSAPTASTFNYNSKYWKQAHLGLSALLIISTIYLAQKHLSILKHEIQLNGDILKSSVVRQASMQYNRCTKITLRRSLEAVDCQKTKFPFKFFCLVELMYARTQ